MAEKQYNNCYNGAVDKTLLVEGSVIISHQIEVFSASAFMPDILVVDLKMDTMAGSGQIKTFILSLFMISPLQANVHKIYNSQNVMIEVDTLSHKDRRLGEEKGNPG